jgi:hypothetical protein
MDKIQSREWDSGKKTSDWGRGQPSKSTTVEIKIKNSSVSSNRITEVLSEGVDTGISDSTKISK